MTSDHLGRQPLLEPFKRLVQPSEGEIASGSGTPPASRLLAREAYIALFGFPGGPCEYPAISLRKSLTPAKAVDASQRTRAVRSLKIEPHGDFWKGRVKPKIRLIGRWLERAGFTPGNRVRVACVAPGVIELRSCEPEPPSERIPSFQVDGGILS